MDEKTTTESSEPKVTETTDTPETPEIAAHRPRPLWPFLIGCGGYAILMLIVLTGVLLIALK